MPHQKGTQGEPLPVCEFSTGPYVLVRIWTAQHFRRETEMLCHCLGSSALQFYTDAVARREKEIFSLRRIGRAHESQLTLDFSPTLKLVTQVRGAGNRVPRPRDKCIDALIACLEFLARGTAFDAAGKPYVRGARYILFTEVRFFVDPAIFEEIGLRVVPSLRQR